ncbi:hypothetical protein KSF_038730 [Reticulibacter mediterranei]|uniref:Dynamin N-terminal domain-containing protein n=2 Tax=Reticulibacter mediterranei TaxID=2778369 RepID=A0A8J3IN98_9CHLR|nr:hypothetical protein KSF_038730 [Reticulibacter mediterranei]
MFNIGAPTPDISSTQPQAPRVAPQTIARLQDLLKELLTSIDKNEAQRYFPGNGQIRAKVLHDWEDELRITQSFLALLVANRVAPQSDILIRQSLTEAIHQFNFKRPFEIKLIGHTGAGKSTLFGAIIGEDISPSGSGDAVTGTRIKVRFADPNNPADGEKMTVYLRDGSSPLPFTRAEWPQACEKYIQEPVGAAVNEVKNVLYVEFVLQNKSGSSQFPPNCEFIDLPGGEAGQERHEEILSEELKQIDALIYVIGTNRVRGNLTRPISEQVKLKITQGQRADIAARKMFVVAAHWDLARPGEDRIRTEEGMRYLLDYLPENYEGYHQHGPNHTYFFYPIRTEDAYLATQGIQCKEQKHSLVPKLQQRGEDYRGHMAGVYEDLRQIDPFLPGDFSATNFNDITLEQHKAMLQFSQLPILIDDLERFLTESRHEVQLDAARSKLTDAIQEFINYGWEQLKARNIDIGNRDPHRITDVRSNYEGQRTHLREEAIISNIKGMEKAWKKCVDQLYHDFNVSQPASNAFHQALAAAFSRAVRHVRTFIQKGHLDHTIDTDWRRPEGANAPVTERLGRELKTREFLSSLRDDLLIALQEELQKPGSAADVLADTFLKLLSKEERPGGPLSLQMVSVGVFDHNSDMQARYDGLKQHIKEQAGNICSFTISGLLLGEHYALDKTRGTLAQLIQFIASNNEEHFTFFNRVHPYMENVLLEMQQRIQQDSAFIIIHYFLREIRKLTKRSILHRVNEYAEPDRIDEEDGDFEKLLRDLNAALLRKLTDEQFVSALDAQLFTHEAEIMRWFDLIRQADSLKNGIVFSQ